MTRTMAGTAPGASLLGAEGSIPSPATSCAGDTDRQSRMLTWEFVSTVLAEYERAHPLVRMRSGWLTVSYGEAHAAIAEQIKLAKEALDAADR